MVRHQVNQIDHYHGTQHQMLLVWVHCSMLPQLLIKIYPVLIHQVLPICLECFFKQLHIPKIFPLWVFQILHRNQITSTMEPMLLLLMLYSHNGVNLILHQRYLFLLITKQKLMVTQTLLFLQLQIMDHFQ